MKTRIFSILKFNRFYFGKQVVTQFVLFEFKPIGSIIFFYFHKSEEPQDRFHTHAFNAISFKFFGTYEEHTLLDEKTGEYLLHKRTEIFKYFTRDSYHRIANSNGCMTMLISGPWKKTWKEWISGKITNYTWGRG